MLGSSSRTANPDLMSMISQVIAELSQSSKRCSLTNPSQAFIAPRLEMYRAQDIVTLTKDGVPTLSEHPYAYEIRQQFGKTIHRIGYQMLQVHPEDVAEHNGLGGAPLWVTFDENVYDITRALRTCPDGTIVSILADSLVDFPFESDLERQLLSWRPWGRDAGDPRYRCDLIDRLTPFKCGTLKVKGPLPPKNLRAYTRRMLRSRDNPSTGILIAIRGLVYDVTGMSNSPVVR
ncbi:hypothetical protein GGR53DRAFT_208508 [Hypoxylon sp. FL1150]|nr:hypothetical protein GGR53DRAFT_208508 [Hypoxylon sp. FL1150]